MFIALGLSSNLELSIVYKLFIISNPFLIKFNIEKVNLNNAIICSLLKLKKKS